MFNLNTLKQISKLSLSIFFLSQIVACSSVSRVLNPFYEDPAPEALLGEKNDHAISGDREKNVNARAALESMATYQRAHAPQPVNPVMQPAVVRLMWVPDHLNPAGDLVPAHYYYLRVLKERFAVQDLFDYKEQIGEKQDASNIPYVHHGEFQN